ncbi:MAG: PepSY-like domain-containing protein [Saprospiraceae bacterium]|nr:PepSY-like domain-containing protein [Saprospiraceae bacterium]
MRLPGIILFAGALIFTACDDTTIDTPDSLIFEIAESVDKVNIDPSELPANAKGVIEDEYFETYIESAAKVQGKGYEVVMGNEDKLYFRHDGLFLRPSMRHDRHGPCGRGILVRPADLPADITAYINENYPDAEILRAKHFVRGWVVLISGRRLLIFNNDLDFIRETSVFHFCDQVGDGIDLTDLRQEIMSYINEHYPAAEVVKARIVRGKVVVGIMTPDGRKILVFDLEGNFLFERG